MIRKTFVAFLLTAISTASPVFAQNQQDVFEARHDRALAAGYKALMLCGAIANAERVGETRDPEHVAAMELTGIQQPHDALVRELPYEIVRGQKGGIDHVEVQWADDMPPRVAEYRGLGGCAVMPIGYEPQTRFEAAAPHADALARNWHALAKSPVRGVLSEAMGANYGAGTRTTSVIVDREGKIVDSLFGQGFGPFTPQRTWSAAKSIAATLVGMAVHRGEADVNASAGLGADASDPRRAITIDHLLRMASGRYSDTPGNRTDSLYFGGGTVEETAAHWPLIHAPGAVFRYANNDTLMAVKAIGRDLENHPPAELFAKLGMHDTVAETDWQGDYVLSSQVWSSARDLALFGQLYLDDGVLPGGERVLPEGWVKYVSTPSGPQPDGAMGYGAGFWLINKSEGVPADTIAANGNRGQYVVIVPSRNVVIVRRGEDPVGARFDIIAFTRDVLAALE